MIGVPLDLLTVLRNETGNQRCNRTEIVLGKPSDSVIDLKLCEIVILLLNLGCLCKPVLSPSVNDLDCLRVDVHHILLNFLLRNCDGLLESLSQIESLPFFIFKEQKNDCVAKCWILITRTCGL